METAAHLGREGFAANVVRLRSDVCPTNADLVALAAHPRHGFEYFGPGVVVECERATGSVPD